MFQHLGERTIKKQRRRKDNNSILFGSTENIELLLQMVISVNQLSLYGAVADMLAELPVDQRAAEKQEILTQRPLAELQANEERQGNLIARI